MKKFVQILFAVVMSVNLCMGQNVSTKEDREALFNYIYEKTLLREAFSEAKESRYGYNPRAEMLKIKDEIVNASTDVELYYALVKLSAARRDSHLDVDLVKDGLVVPPVEKEIAPLRFHPDFKDKGNIFFFVSDIAVDYSDKVAGKVPSIGDILISVNGEPALDYVQRASKFMSKSTQENFLIRMAFSLTENTDGLPSDFFKKDLTLGLRPKNGKPYTVILPYQKKVDWKHGRVLKPYDGYTLVKELKYETFEVYEPIDRNNKTLLLWWFGFHEDLPAASDALVAWAEKKGMLGHDLIIDAIDSRGGSMGAYAIARLSSKPFKTTGGNLKLSDITDDFIANYTGQYLAQQVPMDGDSREAKDDGTWLMDWMHGPLMQGLAAGQTYSNNTPFKCAHLPHYSDWIMQPAKKHFRGNMVVLLGPWGGSHLSQFATMIIENKIGYAMGMPDGGYSNTWEWEEELIFPISKKPVVSFMWNIGHTITPKGQVLEGNPSPVDEFIPVTQDNYLNYKSMLITMAQKRLLEKKSPELVK